MFDYLVASLFETVVAPFVSIVNKHKTFRDFKDATCPEISIVIVVINYYVADLQLLVEVIFHVGENLQFQWGFVKLFGQKSGGRLRHPRRVPHYTLASTRMPALVILRVPSILISALRSK